MKAISIQDLTRMAKEGWRNWVGWSFWFGAMAVLVWLGKHYWHIHSTSLFCAILIMVCLLLIIGLALVEKRGQR